MPMPRKTRLALTAIAATAVSVTAAPSSFAATAHAGTVTAGLAPKAADVSGTANTLGFSPFITKQGDAFAIGFYGPGCGSMTGGTCQDPDVPATGTTWSLDVQDSAGGAVTNLATGTGATLDTMTKTYASFPAAPTPDGTWKVTVTFTNGTDTWSSTTLVDRGTATNAPVAPTLSVKTTGVSAGEPETFYATGSRVAAGSAKHQLLVHYGDGTSDTIDVTGTDPVTFTHVFSGAQPKGTAWVQTFDGTNLSSWAGVSVDVSPVDGKLIVTPTSGTGSVAAPLVVTLDARGSTTGNPGATITAYNFYCYGGTLKLDPATPGLATCTYTTPGTFKVSVSVKDSTGAWGYSPETTVTVTAPGTAQTTVARVSGDTRYDTGVHVSKQRWAATTDTSANAIHPDSVVLATGGGFADALAGVPFSTYKHGALLLTEPTQLTPAVRDEIKRILPADGKHTVYVLGGTAALSPAVEKAVADLGYTVKRISGATRYDTALEIAHAMGNPAHTVVARGDDFADALAAGPLASDLFGTTAGSTYVPAAIVLSSNKSLDSATTAYLKDRYTVNSGAGQSVVAVGGGAAQALTAVPGFDHNAGSFTGATRYETASKVADEFLKAKPAAPVGVATGMAYPDALTGGAFMAATGGPLLLTAPTAPSEAMTTALTQRNGKIADVYVFGGEKAVAAAVFDSIVATVHGIAKQF